MGPLGTTGRSKTQKARRRAFRRRALLERGGVL